MKPERKTEVAPSGGLNGRRVRLFVALHLAAVMAVYAMALLVGGGLASPPMPPLNTAIPNRPAVTEVPTELAATQAVRTATLAPLPEWTLRAEVAAPWEAR